MLPYNIPEGSNDRRDVGNIITKPTRQKSRLNLID